MTQTAAKWIGLSKCPERSSAIEKDGYASFPCPHFRKEFVVEGEVVSAVLTATARGIYEMFLNGKRTDDFFFSPGWTDYRYWFQFQSRDVTNLLRQGKNCIGATVADGWFAGQIGLFGGGLYGEYRREFLCSLEIQYRNGEKQTICSDETWHASTGGILSADLLNGQTVDAREEIGDFSTVGFDDFAWQSVRTEENEKVEILPELCPPVRSRFILFPKLKSVRDCRSIYDFSQNIAGIPSIRIRAERGSKIRFRYSEVLTPEGELYLENLRRAKATDYYIARGDAEEFFEPHFTYHGFRYMEVKVLEGKAEIFEVSAKVLTNDLKETGSFVSSSGILNRFYENVLWGQRGNFVSVPTDCPQRDERLGWAGDTQVFARVAMYNADCEGFYKKYLRDVRFAINPDNGALYNIAPKVPVADEGNNAWGDVITQLPYDCYLMYGDRQMLAENLSAMKGWVDYLVRESENYIRKPGYRNPGDWLNANDNTNIRVFNTIYSAHSADLTARVCQILGDSDSERYREVFEKFRKAFRQEFVSADGRIQSDTQTAYVLAAAFGLCPVAEVMPHLVRRLEERSVHLSTGFAGVRYVMDVLCDGGRADLAYRLSCNTSYPSWGYSILNGATTIWERWDSITRYYGAEVFADASMNSFNHYSLGSAAEWLYSRVLGIQPIEKYPGFERMLFAPVSDPTGRVTHAAGSFVSGHGRIDSKWERIGNTVCFTLKKPSSLLAEFQVEGAKRFVQDGNTVSSLRADAEETQIYCESELN